MDPLLLAFGMVFVWCSVAFLQDLHKWSDLYRTRNGHWFMGFALIGVLAIVASVK